MANKIFISLDLNHNNTGAINTNNAGIFSKKIYSSPNTYSPFR